MSEIKDRDNLLFCYEHLRKEALISEELVFAMLANSCVETGGTFDYTTKQVGRSDPAIGLFQFDPRGGLYSLYMDYLDSMGMDDSAESQMDMMVDILTLSWDKGVNHIGRGNVSKVILAAEEGAEEATRVFCDRILRPGKPHIERRLAALNEIMQCFSQ